MRYGFKQFYFSTANPGINLFNVCCRTAQINKNSLLSTWADVQIRTEQWPRWNARRKKNDCCGNRCKLYRQLTRSEVRNNSRLCLSSAHNLNLFFLFPLWAYCFKDIPVGLKNWEDRLKDKYYQREVHSRIPYCLWLNRIQNVLTSNTVTTEQNRTNCHMTC